MTGLLQKLLLSASMAAGMGFVASAPAIAGSLTGPSTTGNVLIYCSDGTTTTVCSDLTGALVGSALAPGGNVELAADSESGSFDFNSYSSLTGTIGGKAIEFRSLVKSDWSLEFTKSWLASVATGNGLNLATVYPTAGGMTLGALLNQAANLLVVGNQLAALSDPNLSFVNQDNTTGTITVGLAGHDNIGTRLLSAINSSALPSSQRAVFSSILSGLGPLQASELVKVIYDGQERIFYSTSATGSGQTAGDDGVSHSGTYLISFEGEIVEPPTKVPEPSALLGLAAVGGLVVAQKRRAAKG
ncbi:MAG: NF038130 family PEP-CTERM protein [Cyanobacteria bacterium]|nr:NF038130 family PEP-CTERM protein [Cyanobacteriota bacterium]